MKETMKPLYGTCRYKYKYKLEVRPDHKWMSSCNFLHRLAGKTVIGRNNSLTSTRYYIYGEGQDGEYYLDAEDCVSIQLVTDAQSITEDD